MPKLKLEVGRYYLGPDGERVKIEALYPLHEGELEVEVFQLSGIEAGKKFLYHSKALRACRNQRPVCRCQAYDFPHHRGLGRCHSEGAT